MHPETQVFHFIWQSVRISHARLYLNGASTSLLTLALAAIAALQITSSLHSRNLTFLCHCNEIASERTPSDRCFLEGRSVYSANVDSYVFYIQGCRRKPIRATSILCQSSLCSWFPHMLRLFSLRPGLRVVGNMNTPEPAWHAVSAQT